LRGFAFEGTFLLRDPPFEGHRGAPAARARRDGSKIIVVT
jgi:hypothetical protein